MSRVAQIVVIAALVAAAMGMTIVDSTKCVYATFTATPRQADFTSMAVARLNVMTPEVNFAKVKANKAVICFAGMHATNATTALLAMTPIERVSFFEINAVRRAVQSDVAVTAISASMRISGDFTAVLADPAKKAAVAEGVATDLSKWLGVDKARIIIDRLAAGSLIVEYSVEAVAGQTEEQAKAEQQAFQNRISTGSSALQLTAAVAAVKATTGVTITPVIESSGVTALGNTTPETTAAPASTMMKSTRPASTAASTPATTSICDNAVTMTIAAALNTCDENAATETLCEIRTGTETTANGLSYPAIANGASCGQLSTWVAASTMIDCTAVPSAKVNSIIATCANVDSASNVAIATVAVAAAALLL